MRKLRDFDKTLGRLGLLRLLVGGSCGFCQSQDLDFVVCALKRHAPHRYSHVVIRDVAESQRVYLVVELVAVDAVISLGFVLRWRHLGHRLQGRL